MKNSITVIGVEADGIRGLRLEENKAQWDVADSEFWPIDGGLRSDAANPDDAQGGSQAPATEVGGDGTPPAEDISPEDRYTATVAALKDAAKRFGTNEVVLSMPLSTLLVRVSRTPVEQRDSLAETADAELGKVSPFPDETPVAGMETVSETDRDIVTVFAALPESGAAEIGDALDEAKLRVVRTDITALGWLRTLWPEIFKGTGSGSSATRRVVLMGFDDGWDLVVFDEGAPSLLRGLGRVSAPEELSREVTLSLLQAGAGGDIAEVAVFSKRAVDTAIVGRLSAFAPVRVEVLPGDLRPDSPGLSPEFGGVEGVARRTQEGSPLDVTPADWNELRIEARFTRKLKAFAIAAAAGWLLIMGVLFGGPLVYGHLTDRQKTISRRHAKAYGAVKEMRDKVKLVQQYSDHARGSLEMLKAVSDRMPEGVTLTSYSYRRGERLTVIGEAAQPTDVYDFKNALTEAEIVFGEEGESQPSEKLFADVVLTGPSQSRGVHKFTIECKFEAEEKGK